MRKRQLICDVELTYKKTEMPKVKIEQSSDAVPLCRSLIPNGQIALREYFIILLLNRCARVTSRSIISIGGMHTTVVDPKVVFQTALAGAASALILCHNHPSGTVEPSKADLQLTKRIVECGSLLDIAVLDHIILSGYADATPAYFSFADQGLL